MSKDEFYFKELQKNINLLIFKRQLYKLMNQIANMLKSYDVKKGDRVAVYMPCCTMAAATMLACARIGALHSVIFAGFSAESLASRINDCKFNSFFSLL